MDNQDLAVSAIDISPVDRYKERFLVEKYKNLVLVNESAFNGVVNIKSDPKTFEVKRSTSREDLLDCLNKMSFVHSETVSSVGSFARRGSVVDFYPVESQLPVRVDFSYDEPSAYFFDVSTQMTTEQIESFSFLVSGEKTSSVEAKSLFKNFLRFLFDGTHQEFKETITALGKTPIPKHLGREATPKDAERYQTIYAKHEGAVAAPTAGLHFSKLLMKQMELKGVEFAETTLHVGLGTFHPILVEDLSKHKMESEEINIPELAANQINNAKSLNKKICAVGTTVMRTIESSVSTKNEILPYKGWTNIFLFPPYNFRVANCMLTNFHLPQSALMMQVAAFAGNDILKKAYKEAIQKKYNFHTYGDAMLII